jgi:uncharacterized protein YndB with AHSA1/START domain
MKAFKIIFIVVGVIIVIPMALAVFVSKDYNVKRDVIIDKPRNEVFDYVRYLKNQDHFNKWVMMDTEMKKDFRGTDGSTGCVYYWDGEKAGKGEQELVRIVEGDRIECELRFIKPFENTAHAQIITEEIAPNKTRVTWGMAGKNSYPMNFMNLFMNSMLGSDLDESLSTLKNVLEKNATSMSSE